MTNRSAVEFIVREDGSVTARETVTGIARAGDSKGVALNRLAKALERHERGGESIEPYDSGPIRLEHTADGWVATAPDRELNSVACPTRQAALEDLDETVAFVDDDLELSDETKAVLADAEESPESGDAISFDDVETSPEDE